VRRTGTPRGNTALAATHYLAGNRLFLPALHMLWRMQDRKASTMDAITRRQILTASATAAGGLGAVAAGLGCAGAAAGPAQISPAPASSHAGTAPRPAALTGGVALFTGAREVSPAMTQWLVSQFLRTPPRAAIECMRAIAAADFRPDLPAFTVPTLILHGDADQLNPIDRTGKRTAQAIRGAELKIYEGAPHGLPVTDKERFTRDVLAFVRG
jgi:pimeloyl-ACP methyl ester carboxylesterase